MKKPTHCICCKCDNEVYSDEKLYDLAPFGVGFVCEECFIDYVKNNELLSEDIIDEDGWSGELLADYLDIDTTTAESHIDNEYELMFEEQVEERRDMYL